MKFHFYLKKKFQYCHMEYGRCLIRWQIKDPLGNNTYRAYFVFAICGYSMILQLYQPGAKLDWHRDGPFNCPSICFELWNPGTGGLEVDYGKHFRFQDIILFNGADLHRMAPSNRHRISLIFQMVSKRTREVDTGRQVVDN